MYLAIYGGQYEETWSHSFHWVDLGLRRYAPTYAQTIRGEAANHPRIAAAIRELEGPIAYMERAPHGFGGHKAAAIRDSRTALVELRAALAYRAQKDR